MIQASPIVPLGFMLSRYSPGHYSFVPLWPHWLISHVIPNGYLLIGLIGLLHMSYQNQRIKSTLRFVKKNSATIDIHKCVDSLMTTNAFTKLTTLAQIITLKHKKQLSTFTKHTYKTQTKRGKFFPKESKAVAVNYSLNLPHTYTKT